VSPDTEIDFSAAARSGCMSTLDTRSYDNERDSQHDNQSDRLIMRRSGLLTEDLDYHLVRASMVIMFFFFGYQKWWPYEAERLVPFISNGPLIWWLYPLFGHQGASWFLGVSEWTFGSLLLAGFWDKRLGIIGAAGSTATFIATVTIIPFMPEGWDPVAGFPAMTGNVPFLMKDVVLLAVSFYLLKQDVVRITQHEPAVPRSNTAGLVHSGQE
jgi:uncharacterized membrane protein YkgB